MLLCLAMQMLADADAECRCRCKADAECRMQMQNALQMQIALQKCRSENTLVLSQTACAPEALGRIQSLMRIPPGLGCWAKSPGETSGRFLRGVLGTLFDVLEVSWRGPGEAQRGPGEAQRVPGEALEACWRPLGAPKTAWSAKGGLPGAYGALLGASWGTLGGLRGRT